ncbi:hypothetical protein Tco_0795206 [Tanacetum coccineum]
MEFEPSFPPINIFRNRMSAQHEPLLSRDQVVQELRQYQEFKHHLEAAIQNAQNVQNSLLPPFTTISPQMPPIPPPSTSPPLLQPQYHLLEHHFHHQAPLSLLINPYGWKIAGSLQLHWPVLWQWNRQEPGYSVSRFYRQSINIVSYTHIQLTSDL